MPPELLMSLLRSFGMLLLVLALLVLVLWVLRKYSGHHAAGGKPGMIRTRASMSLGPRERIALVEVLGERFLIGITSQQISFLTRIEADLPPEEDPMAQGKFGTFLKRTMGGGGAPKGDAL